MPDVMRTFNNVIDESIGNVGERLDDLVRLKTLGLKVQVTNFPGAGIFNPEDLTDNAFFCIRALAQVQDLVTDKSWFDPAKTKAQTAKENTKTLDGLIKSDPYTKSIDLLKGSKLQSAFTQQFSRPFVNGNLLELGERLLQIQKLNSDLVSHFANP
jgi:hypothetical protein